MYPSKLQLYKANSFDTDPLCLDLDLSITNGIVSSKICDKRFEMVFPVLDGDVPRSPSHSVYICSLIVLRGYVLMLVTSKNKQTNF